MIEQRDIKDPESQRLIATHTPLVKKIAQGLLRGLPASVDADDLVQDGLLGLMSAILRTTAATTGRQFEKYISQRIRGAMIDGLRENDPGSRRVRSKMRQVELAIQRLGHQLGRAPSEGEVAVALSMPLAEYQALLQAAHGYFLISLEDLAGTETGDDYFALCASQQLDPLVVLERAEFQNLLIGAIGALPEREALVMNLYYRRGKNMRDIGAQLEVTEGRVSQIHSQAIARLRAVIVGEDELPALLAPRRKPRNPP